MGGAMGQLYIFLDGCSCLFLPQCFYSNAGILAV